MRTRGMASSPTGRVLARHAERAISEALADMRVVPVNGARQSGKSTLLHQFSRSDEAGWRDLDLPLVRQAAVADPIGFVDYPGMMVIDEIQPVPELLLPIKVQVDGDPRPGRYLLSGSRASASPPGQGTSVTGRQVRQSLHSLTPVSPRTCWARTPGR
jgi:uncharacterized protein